MIDAETEMTLLRRAVKWLVEYTFPDEEMLAESPHGPYTVNPRDEMYDAMWEDLFDDELDHCPEVAAVRRAIDEG